MAKIIAVTDTTVSIGMEDGSIKEVRGTDCNFEPQIGKEVEVFMNETQTIISEVEKKTIPSQTIGEGINISIKNDNNNSNNAGGIGTVYRAGKVVNKVVYLLLAFFLGGLGVHKFYAGKIGSGILYFIFSWTSIPMWISFVEFIIACCKTADVNGNIVI